MILIGLAGKAGSGKDTAAAYLRKTYGFSQSAFAGPLKSMLAAVGIHEPARDQKELPLPGWDFSYRKAAQTLGTEWGRDLQGNFWLKLAENNIEMLQSVPVNLVQGHAITDVRFENEAEMVRSKGGVIIHIEGREYAVAAHASEAGVAVQPKDFIVRNDSTLEKLYTTLDCIISDIKRNQA
jgi:hypothetical protein